jgi:hypothetical protein
MKLTTDYRGFAALMSVIIIALVLMLVTTSLSFGGYYTRFNTLDKEFKEISVALAESCVEVARLRLAKDPLYSPADEVVSLGEGTCRIVSVSVSGGTIHTAAEYKDHLTYLEVSVNPLTQNIISWREVAGF